LNHTVWQRRKQAQKHTKSHEKELADINSQAPFNRSDGRSFFSIINFIFNKILRKIITFFLLEENFTPQGIIKPPKKIPIARRFSAPAQLHINMCSLKQQLFYA
jgi:hypothetical protein